MNNSQGVRLGTRTSVERAGGFRPCGGLSRNDRTPATCMLNYDIHAQGGGRGLNPIQQSGSGACLAHRGS
jgi:hypothetical protein